MKEPVCEECQHFRQHYIRFDKGRYDPIPCGHCVFPRLKHRRTDTPACVHFKKKKSPEN